MEPVIQTKSRKPFRVWLAIVGVPIWAATFLIYEWNEIMAPCGYCIEIVLSGMTAGWIFVVIASKLKAKQREGKGEP
jgi:hypothetical protein